MIKQDKQANKRENNIEKTQNKTNKETKSFRNLSFFIFTNNGTRWKLSFKHVHNLKQMVNYVFFMILCFKYHVFQKLSSMVFKEK